MGSKRLLRCPKDALFIAVKNKVTHKQTATYWFVLSGVHLMASVSTTVANAQQLFPPETSRGKGNATELALLVGIDFPPDQLKYSAKVLSCPPPLPIYTHKKYTCRRFNVNVLENIMSQTRVAEIRTTETCRA